MRGMTHDKKNVGSETININLFNGILITKLHYFAFCHRRIMIRSQLFLASMQTSCITNVWFRQAIKIHNFMIRENQRVYRR